MIQPFIRALFDPETWSNLIEEVPDEVAPASEFAIVEDSNLSMQGRPVLQHRRVVQPDECTESLKPPSVLQTGLKVGIHRDVIPLFDHLRIVARYKL